MHGPKFHILPILRRVTRSAVALALAGFLLAGCGEETAGTDFPPAGEMRILSVEPLQEAKGDSVNLIANGEFARWWAGSPAPEGFQTPDDAFSKTSRTMSNTFGESVRQQWVQGDHEESTAARLRTLAEDAPADTEYELEVWASLLRLPAPGVGVWLNAGDDDPEQLLFLEVAPLVNVTKRYVRRFRTTDAGDLIIGSTCTGSGDVVWHSWRLRPI